MFATIAKIAEKLLPSRVEAGEHLEHKILDVGFIRRNWGTPWKADYYRTLRIWRKYHTIKFRLWR